MMRYSAGVCADFNCAIELDPNYAWAYINRGVPYISQGDLTRAIAHFNRAIELDSNSNVAYCNAASAYTFMGDSGQACEQLAKAIALDPEYPDRARAAPNFDAIHNVPCFQALLSDPTAPP